MRTTLLALLVTAPLTAQLDGLLVVEKRKDLSARNHLVQHLRGVKVTVSFTDASAKEVVGYLQAVSGKGTNFLLASRTMKDGDYPTVTMKLSNISVANLMAAYEEKTNLRFTYRAGLVFLKPKDEVKDEVKEEESLEESMEEKMAKQIEELQAIVEEQSSQIAELQGALDASKAKVEQLACVSEGQEALAEGNEADPAPSIIEQFSQASGGDQTRLWKQNKKEILRAARG